MRDKSLKNPRRLPAFIHSNSCIFLPPTLTYSASFLNLLPLHSWQTVRPENLFRRYLYWILYLFASTHLKNSLIPIRDSSSVAALTPSHTKSRCLSERLQYGSNTGIPYLAATCTRWSLNHPIFSPFQQAIAPSYMLFVLSGTTRSSLTPIILPSPPHTGQAPRGLLKLNIYSSGSRNVIPSASNLLTKLLKSLLPDADSRSTYIVPFPLLKQVAMDECNRVLRSSHSF